jgi:NADH-quinone oxidoreductase subunit N
MDYRALLYALLPDLLVVVALFAALGVDYARMRGRDLAARYRMAARISAWGLFAGLVVIGLQLAGKLPLMEADALALMTDGQLVLNPGTLALKALLFALGLAVLPLAARHPVTPQASEYFALLLLATLGMGFVVTSRNLLGAFVALELLSLSLYALTALHQTRRTSAEAALKYLTYGGVSSAFLLFGLSYLYGMTGALDLTAMGGAVSSERLVIVAYLFILVGLGFKIAVAPFHLWTPDVYQSAPTPAAAWVASGSKIASVALLLVLLEPVAGQSAIVTLLAAMAVLSMTVGNLGALRQSNLKRLLAYSAIANAGYVLVAIVAFNDDGRAATVFYTVVYAIATLGAFAVVALLSDRLGREADIDDFRGCWKTNPGLAAAMLIFILSLAGIPPLAGFVGKLYLFFAAIKANPQIGSWANGGYGLVALALGFSVVALYYYLKVLKAIFVSEENGALDEKPVDLASGAVVLMLALLTVAVGIWPQKIIAFIKTQLFHGLG